MGEYSFEVELAKDAARSFSESTSLGCAVTSADGTDVVEADGYTCESCALCRRLGREEAACRKTHLYGMTEAERFGGRYIYFCQRGLTFFVSPIIGQRGGEAKITVGPFLMVEADDFLSCELTGLGERALLSELVREIPYVPSKKVTRLSKLLFMAVGFLNNVSYFERMRQREAEEAIQGQLNAYIAQVKQARADAPYPFDKERALSAAIVNGDRREAAKTLNELLGDILLLSGASFMRTKARVNELIVTLCRAVIEAGAEEQAVETMSERYFTQLSRVTEMDALCRWLTVVIGELTGLTFSQSDAKHANMIRVTNQFIRAHIGEKLDVETLARNAYLSPDYFSRLIREETGKTVTQLVNDARMKKATELMRASRLKLAEIAQIAGFEDQSYFTRLFTKTFGMPPNAWRRQHAK